MSSMPTAATAATPSPVNSASTAHAAAAVPWTCPFCVLLCDSASLAVESGHYVMLGCDCPSARKALQHFTPGVPSTSKPRIGASDATLVAAIEEAAKRLAASRQPLFGGLATDVDGARALYPLACATGAIYDAAGGASQLHGLRALQDRGAFTTTLAEVRNRADLIVCIGGSPGEALPDVWRRFGIGEDLVAQREVVVVGAPAEAALAGQPRTTASSVALQGDLFDTVSTLAALVAQRRVPASDALTALAARLRAARYAVIVWESARLPEHGALIVESLNALVATLNRSTRAASFPISGKDGLSSVNYTFTWLSGLALRSRAGPLGLEHEPLRFDAKRLLAEGSVDALLWVSCFGPEPALPATSLPCVVVGHPAMQVPEGAVFIPVATPGIGAPGHMFRADGGVVLPLYAVQDDGLPQLPEVLKAITKRVNELKGARA